MPKESNKSLLDASGKVMWWVILDVVDKVDKSEQKLKKGNAKKQKTQRGF